MDELITLIATTFETHHDRLYRYCRSLLGHECDAENAVQDMMVTVVSIAARGGRLPPADDLGRWLFRVAFNACRTIRAQRQRHPHNGLSTDEVKHPAIASGIEVWHKHEAVHAALDKLDSRSRAVLELKYFDGFSDQAIADALDIPVGSASAVVSRARQALANLLNDDFR